MQLHWRARHSPLCALCNLGWHAAAAPAVYPPDLTAFQSRPSGLASRKPELFAPFQQQQRTHLQPQPEAGVQQSGCSQRAGGGAGTAGAWEAAPTAAQLLLFGQQKGLQSLGMGEVMQLWEERNCPGVSGLAGPADSRGPQDLHQPPALPCSQQQQQQQQQQDSAQAQPQEQQQHPNPLQWREAAPAVSWQAAQSIGPPLVQQQEQHHQHPHVPGQQQHQQQQAPSNMPQRQRPQQQLPMLASHPGAPLLQAPLQVQQPVQPSAGEAAPLPAGPSKLRQSVLLSASKFVAPAPEHAREPGMGGEAVLPVVGTGWMACLARHVALQLWAAGCIAASALTSMECTTPTGTWSVAHASPLARALQPRRGSASSLLRCRHAGSQHRPLCQRTSIQLPLLARRRPRLQLVPPAAAKISPRSRRRRWGSWQRRDAARQAPRQWHQEQQRQLKQAAGVATTAQTLRMLAQLCQLPPRCRSQPRRSSEPRGLPGMPLRPPRHLVLVRRRCLQRRVAGRQHLWQSL